MYEKIADRRALYKDALAKIPEPEFIVLYNSKETTPDRWEEQAVRRLYRGRGREQSRS